MADVLYDAQLQIGNAFALFQHLEELAPQNGWVQALCCDVDDLTAFNRVRGYAAGSRVLRELAALLAGVAGDGVAFRFGGDEFIWLRRTEQPDPALAALGSQLRSAFRARTSELGWEVALSVGTMQMQLPASPGQLLAGATHSGRFAKGHRTHRQGAEADTRSLGYELINDLIRRVNESVAALVEARQQAFVDVVSGLPNHRAAQAMLERALAKGPGEPFGLLFIDGDGLKRYNQDYGYEAGNRMIRELSRILQNHLRQEDFLARWLSGDEFLVIVPGADRAVLLRLGERLRSAVEHETASWPVPVTISLGAACFPQHGWATEELLAVLYEANQAAKEGGKNRVAIAEQEEAG